MGFYDFLNLNAPSQARFQTEEARLCSAAEENHQLGKFIFPAFWPFFPSRKMRYNSHSGHQLPKDLFRQFYPRKHTGTVSMTEHWRTTFYTVYVTRSRARIYFSHALFQSEIVIGLRRVSVPDGSNDLCLLSNPSTSNKILNSIVSSPFLFCNTFKNRICRLKTNTTHRFSHVNVFYIVSRRLLVSRDRIPWQRSFFLLLVFHQNVV